MQRVDAALMMGMTDGATQNLRGQLQSFGFAGPAFSCEVEIRPARLVAGGELALGTRVLLVAAIARPERFVEAAQAAGYQITEVLTYPDHHGYPEKTLRQIQAAYESSSAEALLTTSKDRVKLLRQIDLPLAELPLQARPEEKFWTWLNRRLKQQMAAIRS